MPVDWTSSRRPPFARLGVRMSDILDFIAAARERGDILASSEENIRLLLETSEDPVATGSVRELIDCREWKELDDRFFRTLAFGTGGLRGKTIGRVVTAAEQGEGGPNGRPQHPCVGTNTMNRFNLSRATQGLCSYVLEWHAASGRTGRPSICIAHDTRHFSREFAEFVARVIADHGIDALLFDGPRSTPELSFAVRKTRSVAGINLTASHNPPEYNGYKVYFSDGGQIVEPDASRIIERVRAVAGERYEVVPENQRGSIRPLGREIDEAYISKLESLVLDPVTVRAADLSVVFSPLHGVGSISTVPVLERIGCRVSTVGSQEIPDGRFPTVKSPNPENAEALTLAIEQAEAVGADLVMASDPDADRLGVAARDSDGRMRLLTGNQIGSLIAAYRARKFFEMGILNDSTRERGVIIKTFVTTDLQARIAEKYGLRCVETLTGFKYIGAKLRKYEEAIPAALRPDYDALPEDEKRRLLLEHSSLFVFGGEESYGYSGGDFARDKDANAAAVMFAEVAAHARSLGITLHALLDELFAEFGVHLEHSESIVMEGADGARRIRALIESYRPQPPAALAGSPVVRTQDFSTDEIFDSEGDRIPAEAMMMFHTADGCRVAVRPSGTEPKIKYYLFAVQPPSADVAGSRRTAAERLEAIWTALREDVDRRLAGLDAKA